MSGFVERNPGRGPRAPFSSSPFADGAAFFRLFFAGRIAIMRAMSGEAQSFGFGTSGRLAALLLLSRL